MTNPLIPALGLTAPSCKRDATGNKSENKSSLPVWGGVLVINGESWRWFYTLLPFTVCLVLHSVYCHLCICGGLLMGSSLRFKLQTGIGGNTPNHTLHTDQCVAAAQRPGGLGWTDSVLLGKCLKMTLFVKKWHHVNQLHLLFNRKLM